MSASNTKNDEPNDNFGSCNFIILFLSSLVLWSHTHNNMHLQNALHIVSGHAESVGCPFFVFFCISNLLLSLVIVCKMLVFFLSVSIISVSGEQKIATTTDPKFIFSFFPSCNCFYVTYNSFFARAFSTFFWMVSQIFSMNMCALGFFKMFIKSFFKFNKWLLFHLFRLVIWTFLWGIYFISPILQLLFVNVFDA